MMGFFQPMTFSLHPVRVYLCASALIFAGCLVGPKYRMPAPTKDPIPAGYKESPARKETGAWKVANPNDGMLRGAWWKVFKDHDLDALEDQLNINNQNIKQFYQNYMVARAMVREANSQFYPTLTANGSYTRARTPPGMPATSILSILDASWEPDIWGKVANTVHAVQYNAQASAALLENERLSEQASLATYYFQIRGQDSLQKLYNDTIIEDKKSLDFTKAQFETGMTDQIAVVQATNTLENAQAAAVNVGVARAQYEHAIAVLVGKSPSSFSIPVRPLEATPPAVPVGVPSWLIERRPDIAAAERAMAQSNAQIGMAMAAYFPSVTIGGDRGYSANAFSQLFQSANRLWSVGPSVSETIFDGGLRRATVHQYVASYNANLAAYRETVLTAFQQVEDSLSQVRILSKQLVLQRQAEESAKTFVKLEINRYQTGIDPYIDVVTAQTTLLTDQLAVINVRVQEMTGCVQLVKALGGGWEHVQLPTASDVAKRPTHAETAILR